MRVELSSSEGLERKLTIAVPAAEVDASVAERLRETAKNIRLNGFRKGKVPLSIVKKRFGPGIRQEVVGELMNKSFVEAIEQEGLRPAGQPKLELTELDEGKDLQFAAVFEVVPEIELPDFSRIKVESLTAEVTDEDIANMIETLRKQRQTWEQVERAAAADDLVSIDYAGRVDGEEFEGGKAENAGVLIGSERMIPGFEESIKDRQPGDEFTCKLKFPDEYHQEDLAGKDVEFDIRLNRVSEARLPEVDDEFYKSFGVEEGGEDAFREEIVRNMERELKAARRSKLKGKLTEAVVKRANITVPEAMMSEEVARLRAQAAESMGGAGENMPDLPDDLLRDQARRRVVMGLVLTEIVKTKELKADAAKVREAIEELASTYESPEEVVRWYYGNEEQLSAIEASVLEDQVFDYISEQAKLTEKTVTYQEAIRG
ncbi:MAG: trigger factor [Gammaproteobacteria bacterium]|nr:trigger factor [Gammaproteobacteria bacterium]MYH86996.1 trigger factor [Gammaproteobacteria bacterium]MYK03910.1 trigger factor [Gammaproteobacteria bacterium]